MAQQSPLEHDEKHEAFVSVNTVDSSRELTEQEKTNNVTKLTTRETLLPLILVALMYSLGGFHGGFSDVLGKRFQDALGLTKRDSAGLHVAHYR